MNEKYKDVKELPEKYDNKGRRIKSDIELLFTR